PLETDSRENCAEIVHALLERRVADVTVRKTRAALVEQDHPGEPREPTHPVAVKRILPREVDVRDPAGHDDEIERAIAYDLVGDVDVTALGVAGVSSHRVVRSKSRASGRA